MVQFAKIEKSPLGVNGFSLANGVDPDQKFMKEQFQEQSNQGLDYLPFYLHLFDMSSDIQTTFKF